MCDNCPNGLGRLCQLTDVSGTTQWTYDLFGRVETKTQTTGNVSLTIQYGYDATTGELKTITYPSGNVISLTYTDGKISDITSNRGALMQNMTYDAFGPLTRWDWGNGDPMQRTYNQDGQLEKYTRGKALFQINYNLTGNLKEVLDPSDSANNQTYDYDPLQRLTHFNRNRQSALMAKSGLGVVPMPQVVHEVVT